MAGEQHWVQYVTQRIGWLSVKCLELYSFLFFQLVLEEVFFECQLPKEVCPRFCHRTFEEYPKCLRTFRDTIFDHRMVSEEPPLWDFRGRKSNLWKALEVLGFRIIILVSLHLFVALLGCSNKASFRLICFVPFVPQVWRLILSCSWSCSFEWYSTRLLLPADHP